ncbi:hypothetical protein PRIPAC_93666 [Pristionchus pacificus]|uniref:Uncharacterized protein n=1 Tax=Pristionchus pacificus TaxID=54126 RepID=A0A2A6BR14_PRIPA|nr:hypothetical protein PRIPAC_93666 [Pristionchus pacificus]|eukprot:PDM68335.1 hypothetical protein PRIPAC_46379 [Pristionchus pacificus]
MKATLLLPLLLVFVTSEKCCPLHKVVMLRNEERDVLNLFPKGREIWECPTWATLFCFYAEGQKATPTKIFINGVTKIAEADSPRGMTFVKIFCRPNDHKWITEAEQVIDVIHCRRH